MLATSSFHESVPCLLFSILPNKITNFIESFLHLSSLPSECKQNSIINLKRNFFLVGGVHLLSILHMTFNFHGWLPCLTSLPRSFLTQQLIKHGIESNRKIVFKIKIKMKRMKTHLFV